MDNRNPTERSDHRNGQRPQQQPHDHKPLEFGGDYVSYGDQLVGKRTFDGVMKCINVGRTTTLIVGGILSVGSLLNGILFVTNGILGGGWNDVGIGTLLLIGGTVIGSMTNRLYVILSRLLPRRGK